MMSKKQWLALLAVFVTYLLLGAAIFYHIEEPREHERRQQERAELWLVHNLLHQHNYSGDLIRTLEDYCQKPMLIPGPEPELEPMIWNFYNSFFFVITVVSTIGYGNLAPTCALSRILMILYALIGIPINGILLASLGEFFSMTLLRARHRHKHDSAGYLMVDILRYLVPGFVVFIFLPAAVFSYVEENWTYDMGVYYAFVTLTTIGFGDLVAGQSSRGQDGVFIVYRIALIVWVVFGLGYLVMLLGFITRAMRSKKMARIEHKLAENLRLTQSKIWNGFTKDMSYFRRIINEMYLQKLKPVYRDEDNRPRAFLRTRSSSEPVLRMSGDVDSATWRRRANSEVLPHRGLQRVLSESDLGRIDKDATFATATVIEPVEFLTRFVSAFGGGQDEEGGVQGFSDQEILASERWTLGGDFVPPSRQRAASEVRITMPDDKMSSGYNAEWTWSGDVASRRIHELMRARRKSMWTEKEPLEPDKPAKRNSFSASFLQLPKWRNPLRMPKVPVPGRKKAKSFSAQSLQDDSVSSQINYMTHTHLQSYLAGSAGGRLSLFSSTAGSGSTGDINSVLEETSLADFFRALSSVHTRVEAPPPQRKDGTASLTSLFVPPPTIAGERRFSVQPPQPRRASLRTAQAPVLNRRRSSLRPPTPTYRRNSLRPANTTNTPTFSRSARRFSVRPTANPPPIPARTRTLRQEMFQRQMSDTNLIPRRTRHESLRDM